MSVIIPASDTQKPAAVVLAAASRTLDNIQDFGSREHRLYRAKQQFYAEWSLEDLVTLFNNSTGFPRQVARQALHMYGAKLPGQLRAAIRTHSLFRALQQKHADVPEFEVVVTATKNLLARELPTIYAEHPHPHLPYKTGRCDDAENCSRCNGQLFAEVATSATTAQLSYLYDDESGEEEHE